MPSVQSKQLQWKVTCSVLPYLHFTNKQHQWCTSGCCCQSVNAYVSFWNLILQICDKKIQKIYMQVLLNSSQIKAISSDKVTKKPGDVFWQCYRIMLLCFWRVTWRSLSTKHEGKHTTWKYSWGWMVQKLFISFWSPDTLSYLLPYGTAWLQAALHYCHLCW